MGRTIPSFRQLLEIEKLDWSTFKKLLPTKIDKQVFNEIFENAKLYTSYLGNAANPIVLESVIMGLLLHTYKALLHVNKEDVKVNENLIKKGITSSTENCPERKILFDRACKKWHGLIDSLHKEDRELLLTMIIEICNYGDCSKMLINSQDSQTDITYFFYLSAIIQQQKLINKLNKNQKQDTEITTTNKTLSDYM